MIQSSLQTATSADSMQIVELEQAAHGSLESPEFMSQVTHVIDEEPEQVGPTCKSHDEHLDLRSHTLSHRSRMRLRSKRLQDAYRFGDGLKALLTNLWSTGDKMASTKTLTLQGREASIPVEANSDETFSEL